MFESRNLEKAHSFLNSHYKIISIALWCIFAVVVAAVKFDTPPSPGNVYTIYRNSGIDWWKGELLYGNFRFLYLPGSALLFSPLQLFSFEIGGVIWRMTNIFIFAFGVLSLYRICKIENALFPLVSLVVIVLSWSAARHGQMTLAMGGLMMLGISTALDSKYILSSFVLALSLTLKPLALPLVLIMFALIPKLRIYLLLWLVFLLLLPFTFQTNEYVIAQYKAFLPSLSDFQEHAKEKVFIQFHWLLRYLGLELSNVYTMLVRMVFAVTTLFLSWKALSHARMTGLLIYALVASYILFFGVGTESNTYALFSPVIAIVIAEAIVQKNQLLTAIYFIVVGCFIFSKGVIKAYPDSLLLFTKLYLTLFILCVLCFLHTKILNKNVSET